MVKQLGLNVISNRTVYFLHMLFLLIADQFHVICNSVVFGLEEKNSTLETKSDVEDLFHHLVDHDVCVKDAIHLGRRGPHDKENPVHPRPLLSKLMCPWGCHIVLAPKHKLRGYGDGKILIHPDRTLEEWRKDKEHRQGCWLERQEENSSEHQGVARSVSPTCTTNGN